MVSPWNTGSPLDNTNSLPSSLVAFAVPDKLDTSPIDNAPAPEAWTYWPGARGPAKMLSRFPLSKRPFSVKTDGNS